MTATAKNKTPEDAPGLNEEVLKLWTSGHTLAEGMGISEREREALYVLGYSFYERGLYNEAFKIFARLVSLDHLESRYLMALGSAMQMTRRYEAALQQYMVVTLMRLDDPVPVFHSAECLLALGRPAEAVESLKLAIESLCRAGEHDEIRNRAELLLKGISNQAGA